MDIERFIAAIKQEQAVTALEGLMKPRNRDGFEFGLLCGLIQGYERSLELLRQQQDEADGKSRSPGPARMANPYLADVDAAPVLPEQWGRR